MRQESEKEQPSSEHGEEKLPKKRKRQKTERIRKCWNDWLTESGKRMAGRKVKKGE